MDQGFLDKFTSCTGFPDQDRADLLDALTRLGSAGQAALLDAANAYTAAGYSTELLNARLSALEEVYGVHRYTLWLLVLIHCSQAAYERSRDEALFWETFTDIRYKVQECRGLFGICGVFVGFWYPIFFTDSIVKLGRLEFERSTYPGSTPVRIGGFTVSPDDPAYSIHIPSSGEPFTREARLDSYRRAYEHFRCRERGVPLVCWCESWLLYPPYTGVLSESSNIRGFSHDFAQIERLENPEFYDFWRVFPHQDENDPSGWTEHTGLQRAVKAHFLSGGKPGCGLGLLVFDGKHLLQKEFNS